MTIKQLSEHLIMRPFQPFVIRTVSGARHPVQHPDYLLFLLWEILSSSFSQTGQCITLAFATSKRWRLRGMQTVRNSFTSAADHQACIVICETPKDRRRYTSVLPVESEM
ncbi:MAG: hypothetical protein EXS30_00250 [Pedosphaera sp.]|nr:hypothetical protein [Pedosphaera sp.]